MGTTYTVYVVPVDFDLSKVRTFRDVQKKSICAVDMDKWNSFERFLTEEDMEEGGCIKEVKLSQLMDSLTNEIPEDRSYTLHLGSNTVEKKYDPERFLEMKEYAQSYLNEILPYMVGGFRFILIAG